MTTICARVDDATLDFLNARLLPTDIAHVRLATDAQVLRNAPLLGQIATARRFITFADLAHLPTVLSLAQANGVTGLCFDDESTTDGPTLDANWRQAREQIHAAGLHAWYAPTGRMLQKWVPVYPDLVGLAHGLIYQTESQMGQAGYVANVQSWVQTFKQIKPLPVLAQLSVTPPSNPTIDAATVIALVDALLDGSARAPDGVGIFYPMDDTTQLSVWKAVIGHYRAAA